MVTSAGPWLCLLCRAEVETDDVVVTSARMGRCVCVRCYDREVGRDVHMLAHWRRAWERVLNDMDHEVT